MCRKKRQTRVTALSDTRFRRFFPVICMSTIAGWILRFLLGLSAWELTHSSAWVGIVVFVLLAPTFLLTPYFGIQADRINPRRGMQLAMLFNMLIAVFASLAAQLGLYTIWTVVVLALFSGAVVAMQVPMRLALVPLLVPRDLLASAVGLSSVVFNSTRILGPALAAALVLTWSTSAVWLLAALFFGLAAVLLYGLKEVGVRPPPLKESLFSQFRAGLHYAASQPAIKLLFGFAFLNGMLGRTAMELLPAISGQLLHGEAAELAVLSSSAGAGSILAGFMVSRLRDQHDVLLRLIVSSLLAVATLHLSVRWASETAGLAIFIGLMSFGTTIVGTVGQILAQLVVADEYRGRVMSLWSILILGIPALSALAVGTLAEQFGFASVWLLLGAIGWVLTLVFYARRAVFAEPPRP